MTKQELVAQIKAKRSFLCVGLDPDLKKLPASIDQNADGVLHFNRRIIQSTHQYAVAYKPNLAFYESLGARGWNVLQETMRIIPQDIFTIADAKRGDIGNTAHHYAKAFFEIMDFDAITISPYMGVDSILPFLEYPGKWVIILGLTSNQGSQDLQLIEYRNQYFFEIVLDRLSKYGSCENVMFVIGATQSDYLDRIRSIIPEHFLLVPGIGAQGGDLNQVYRTLANDQIGILVNSSRSIIYAGQQDDFDLQSGLAAKKMQEQMSGLLPLSLFD